MAARPGLMLWKGLVLWTCLFWIQDVARAEVQPARQGRAMWVVRHSLLSKQSIDRLVDKASSGGFNTLFVQVCGRGDAYFFSRIYPPAEDFLSQVAGSYDPLSYILEKAHGRGLSVHAWINALLVWSSPQKPKSPGHLLNNHPEWIMFDDRGTSLSHYSLSRLNSRKIEGAFLSPASDQACELLERFIVDLVSRYPVDGLHLDYIRYPAQSTDFSPDARAKFKERYQVDPLHLVSRAGQTNTRSRGSGDDGLLDKWTDFRAELITRFLSRLARRLKEIDPALVRSAAVKPDIEPARLVYGQDWPRWVSEGLLDLVLPMAYSTDADLVYRQLSSACARVGSGHVWAGLRAYDVPVSGILERVRRLRPLNLAGYCFFSYDGVRNNSAFFDRVGAELLSE